MKNTVNILKAAILHQKAEEVAKKRFSIEEMMPSASEMMKLIQELEVHQVELEMQGEELARAKKQLEASSENHYRTLFNAIDEGFCIIEVIFDANKKPIDYRFLETNPSFGKQTGLINAQGKRMRELKPNHEEHWFEIYGKIALTGQPLRFENFAEQLHRWYDVYAFRVGQPENRQVGILFNDITRYKQAEKALRENENKLRAIMEQTTDFIALADANGFITYASSASELYFLYPPDEICGHHFTEFIDESVVSNALEVFKEIAESNARSKADWVLKRRDNSTFIGEVNAAKFQSGEDNDVLVVIRDVTERKKAEESLKENEKYNRMLFDKSVIGLAVTSMDGRLVDVNQAYANLIGRTIDETLKLKYWDITPGKYTEQEKMQIEFLNTIGRYGPYEKEYIHKDGHLIPVRLNGSIIERKGRKYIWSSVEDITESKKTEIQLIENEEKYRNLFNNSEVGMFRTRLDGSEILEFNEKYLRMLNYTHEEVKGNPSVDLWADKNERDEMVKMLKAECHVTNFECKLLTKQRNVRNCITSLRLYPDDGILEGSIFDITERKQAEETISSLAKFPSQNPEPVVRIGLDGRVLYANEASHRFFTWKLEIGKPAPAILKDVVTDIFKQKISKKIEAEHNTRLFSVFAVPILEFDYANLYFNDITERKQAEETLLKSESLLHTLVQTIPELIWLKDKNGVFLSCNVMFERLIGSKETEIIGKTDYDFIDRELADSFRDNDGKAMAAGKPTTNEEWNTFADDGHRALLEIIKTPMYDSSGTLVGVLGIGHDITERVQANEALILSETRYRRLFESAKDGILILDAETGKIVDVNPFLIDLLGYSKEQFTEKTIWEIGFFKDIIANYEKFLELQQKEYVRYEDLPLETDDGRKINVEFVSNVYSVDHHKVIQCNIRDITKRRRAEETLEKSEKRLRKLIETSGIWVWEVDKDGLYTYVNDMEESILGYKPADIIGKKYFYDFFAPEVKDEITKAAFEVFSKKGSFSNLENINIHLDGHRVVLETSGIPLLDTNGNLLGYLGTDKDITERKQAEEELKSINERFELATNAAAISVWEHDFITDIIKIDDNFNLIYGNTQGNYQIGFNEFIKFIHPDDVDIIKNNLEERIKTDKNTSFEFRVIRPDGVIRNIEAYGKIVKDKTNKPVKFIGINLDISDFKKAEQELITAKEQAEESDRLKSTFLANMSHEIRTPMNGILGFAALLKEPKLTGKEQKEYISIIEKSGARMLNIISDIMSISKVEAGQMDVKISETDVNEQIEYIYTFFSPKAKEKGLRLFYRIQLPAQEAVLNTDKEKLYAILTNLVNNALKYTIEGSIEFGYEKKGKYLEFFVKDTGIGIIPEQKEIIFERFRQGSESHTRNYEGAGLGLSISKAYVEMLGGEIRVESEPGKGSVFYFTVPYNAEPEVKTITENVIPRVAKENTVKNLKILIAEDDKISERLINIEVKIFSREVIIVKNGWEAVETCRNQPDIDLVLMDIKLPQMDGYEAVLKIREFNKEVIIIAQTAYAFAGDRIKAIEAGCDDYIRKPIDKDLLNALINKHFKKKAND